VLEAVVGILLWYGSRLWGLVMGAVLLLAPLELAVLTVSVAELSPTVALVVGTLGAAAMGLPPWAGETRTEAYLASGGVAASWLGWNLVREPDAGIPTLLGMLLVTAIALGTRLLAGRLRAA
jgi:hypothetical protein